MSKSLKIYEYIKELDNSFYNFYLDPQIKINLKDIKEDAKIYRYTSLTNLLSILDGKFYLSPRLAFSDRKEHGEYTSEYIKVCYKDTIDRNRNRFHQKVAEKFKLSTHFNVSCWTMGDIESFPMWKAYKGDEISVRIKTDIQSLLTSIKSHNFNLYCGPMHYGEEANRITMYDILFKKTKEYSEEKEFRLYAIKDEYDLNVQPIPLVMSVDPDELIKEVYFSPFIHHDKVSDLCDLLIAKHPFISDRLSHSDLIEF